MLLGQRTSPLLMRGLSVQQQRHTSARRLVGVCAMSAKRKVAVIGAGAAGLISARELLREGHEVVVFEQCPAVGGVWVFDDQVDSDVLGTDRSRTRVHTSMYRQLRTNLPREVMGFSDFPFDSRVMRLAATSAATAATAAATATDSTPSPPKAHAAGAAAAAAATASQGLPEPSGTAERTASSTACTSVDPRQYCGHEEVLRYLRAFAAFYGLEAYIRFNTRVVSVTPQPAGGGSSGSCGQADGSSSSSTALQPPPYKWRVVTAPSDTPRLPSCSHVNGMDSAAQQGQGATQHEFDAVVVANGHFSEPKLPDVRGMSTCPAFQMHSHSYRGPERFAGQTVLVVGASNSGEDISREVSVVTEQVILCARSWQVPGSENDPGPYGPGNNIYRRPMVVELTQDQTALFEDGSTAHVDSIIYCTGYVYTFPFLQPPQSSQVHKPTSQLGAVAGRQESTELQFGGLPGLVSSQGTYVAPLYLHMLPPALAPWLSFIGLPWKVVPLPQCELQAKLVARALSGRVVLPSEKEMMEAVAEEEDRMMKEGMPERYYHMQGASQFAYNDALARMCGPDVPPTPSWRQHMYASSGLNRRNCPDNFRDVWTDREVVLEARADIDRQLEALQQQASQRALACS